MKTPAEIETLAETQRQIAAGNDPFGDDELDGGVPAAKTAEERIAELTEEPAKEDAVTPEDVAETSVVDEPSSPQPTFLAEVPKDYQNQRKVLMTEKAEAMKKLMEGELEPDAFAEIESRVSDALEDLTAQRIRAETLIEANTQTAAALQQHEIKRLIARTKTEVDYLTDGKAQKQFDMALQMLNADSDNSSRDFGELVAQAHKAVMALRGTPSKAEQVADEVLKRAARKPDGEPPITLRGLPVAATPNSNGDAVEAMGRLSGQAYQEAFKKLSPGQRAKLLDEV